MTETERELHLQRAGYNVFNLDTDDVEIDLFTDIPSRVFVDVGAPAVSELEDLAAELYGPARYTFFVKGRAAELALAAALGPRVKTTVLTHGLFKSTERSLQSAGATIEVCPSSSPDLPTSDLDLEWLDARLAAGGAGVVFLEPNNNGLGGRPLTPDNVEAIARLTRARGVLLALDITRLFTNSVTLGLPVLETARRITACADVMVSSCAKELLGPVGGFTAVPARDLERRAFAYGFQHGTLLEPAEARARLRGGLSHVLANPDVMRERGEQTARLARALVEHGVPCVQPSGGHAVYVRVDGLLDVTDPLSARASEAALYARAGVRAYIWEYPAFGRIMRLAVTIGRYTDRELDTAARAIGELFADGAPWRLQPVVGEEPLIELARRFAPTARRP